MDAPIHVQNLVNVPIQHDQHSHQNMHIGIVLIQPQVDYAALPSFGNSSYVTEGHGYNSVFKGACHEMEVAHLARIWF